MQRREGEDRCAAIDVARALGLGLVYYGHFVEQVMYLKNPAAAVHYKWIYSFHMVLFFVLSGWVRGARSDGATPLAFIKATLASRLVPYLFFSLVVAVLSLAVPGWFPIVDLSTPKGYFMAAVSTGLGFPLFNVPLWFVACLISVECVHRLLRGFLDSGRRIALTALACYIGGYALNAEYFFFGQNANFWMLHEVPVVYAFYLMGVLLGRSRAVQSLAPGFALAVGLAGLAVVHMTYDLNQGPFRYLQAVIILLSGHGHFLWFPATALAGTAMVLAFGRTLQSVPSLVFMGRNALILLGMNGVFYHFVNAPLALWAVANLPGDGWTVFAVSALVASGSLLLCLPVILVLNRAVPQLVGKPRQAGLFFGPILRA
jgi:acyltransferase